jgi:uncharacterized membrane protein YdjX (TVP38/TMEM64 family)
MTAPPDDPRPAPGRRAVLLRLLVLVALLAALGVAAAVVDVPDLATVRARIDALGPLAPLVFTIGYALVVPAPFPKSVLSTAAGLAFGIPLGATVVVLGGTAGAVLAFGLARWLGRDAVARLTDDRVRRVDAAVERHGVAAALVVRFVPILPFTLLNYACGVTAMRLRHYALGTAVGMVPGSTAMVALGSVGGGVSLWVPALASVGLGLVTLGVGALWQWRRTVR